MTHYEAIILLNARIECFNNENCGLCDTDCNDCAIHYDAGTSDEYQEALSLSMEALKFYDTFPSRFRSFLDEIEEIMKKHLEV